MNPTSQLCDNLEDRLAPRVLDVAVVGVLLVISSVRHRGWIDGLTKSVEEAQVRYERYDEVHVGYDGRQWRLNTMHLVDVSDSAEQVAQVELPTGYDEVVYLLGVEPGEADWLDRFSNVPPGAQVIVVDGRTKTLEAGPGLEAIFERDPAGLLVGDFSCPALLGALSAVTEGLYYRQTGLSPFLPVTVPPPYDQELSYPELRALAALVTQDGESHDDDKDALRVLSARLFGDPGPVADTSKILTKRLIAWYRREWANYERQLDGEPSSSEPQESGSLGTVTNTAVANKINKSRYDAKTETAGKKKDAKVVAKKKVPKASAARADRARARLKRGSN